MPPITRRVAAGGLDGLAATDDSKLRIASIGECMIELSPAPELGPRVLRRGFAGDTLNTAVYLARCLRRQKAGHAWSVAYATRLGGDRLSAEMLADWRREGVDVSLVRRDANALPGLYLIETDDHGERQFSYWRESAPARRLFTGPGEAELRASLLGFDAIYFSGITLGILAPEGRERLLALSHELCRRGGLVAFDGNYRAPLWPNEDEARHWLSRAYALAEIALPSVEETSILRRPTAQDLVEHLLELGSIEVVLKQGSGPCLLGSRAGQMEIAPPRALRVVDTTGAGDSFNAGYLAARLTGASQTMAARFGHHLAAQKLGERGAIVPEAALSIPDWEELERGLG
jgi:2-dehydro-3-deoxygluconokinase